MTFGNVRGLSILLSVRRVVYKYPIVRPRFVRFEGLPCSGRCTETLREMRRVLRLHRTRHHEARTRHERHTRTNDQQLTTWFDNGHTPHWRTGRPNGATATTDVERARVRTPARQQRRDGSECDETNQITMAVATNDIDNNSHKCVEYHSNLAVSSLISPLSLVTVVTVIIMNVAFAPVVGAPQGAGQPPPPQQPHQPAPGNPAQPAVPQQPPAPQAPMPPAPNPLGQQPNSYRARYLDPTADVFNGNYTNLYNEYSTTNTTPQDLRTSLYRDGNTGALLHVLMHVRDPANADPNDIASG
jgi:hypothetical protein